MSNNPPSVWPVSHIGAPFALKGNAEIDLATVLSRIATGLCCGIGQRWALAFVRWALVLMSWAENGSSYELGPVKLEKAANHAGGKTDI